MLAACVSRRFITQLEKVKLFPWNRQVFIRPTLVPRVCLSTELEEDNPQRRQFPFSKYWKKQDLTLEKYRWYFGFKRLSFNEMLQDLLQKTDVQRSSVHFYYLMTLKDHSAQWTVHDALGILKLLSTSQMSLTNSERLTWVHYMEKQMEDQGSMTIECHNAILKCYLHLNHRFNPVDILTKLETAGLKPNPETMIYLMKKYIFMKDIQAAKNIYEYVQDTGSRGSKVCSSLMIMGYTMMGMDNEAEKLALSIGSDHRDNLKDEMRVRYIYQPMILGNALAGNVKRLRQLEIELLRIDNRQFNFFTTAIVMCSYQGAREGADFLIEAMGRLGQHFYSTITNPLCSLICNGHHDLAFKWFMQLENPSAHKFYFAAVRGQMPPKIVTKYVKLLEENNIRYSRFEYYFETLLQNTGNADKMKECFPIMSELGIEIRPNDLWMPLLNIDENGGIKGVLEVLPYFRRDVNTEEYVLFPILQRLEVTPAKWLEYIQEHGNLKEPECQYLQLMYAIYLKDKDAISLVLEKGLELAQVDLSFRELSELKILLQRYTTEENIQKLLQTAPSTNSFQSAGSLQQLLMQKGLKRHEPIKKATELFGKGYDKNALICLLHANLESKETCVEEAFECKLFDMGANEKNFKFASEAMRILLKKGYLNTGGSENPSRKYQVKFATEIIRKFFEFVCKSDDDDQLITALKQFQSLGDLKGITLYTLIPMLIKNDKGDLLRSVLVHVNDNGWFTDQVGLSMAIGFFEIGRKDKALDSLQKCFLTQSSCIRMYNLLASENKLEIMQKLYLVLNERFRKPSMSPSKEILEYIKNCKGEPGEEGSGRDFYDLYWKPADDETQPTKPSFEKVDGSYV